MESFEQELVGQSKVLGKGVYGLPEAVANIQSLKSKVSVLNEDRAGLLERIQQMTAAVEKLSDENNALRRQSGMAATHEIELSGVKLAKESLIAELRAVNACLEREVGELEEERRRLKAHLKFSAKFQGQIESDLGLSPEQLSAVEKFVKQLKSKDKDEQYTSRGSANDDNNHLTDTVAAVWEAPSISAHPDQLLEDQSMDTSDQHQTASKSIEEDIGHNTGSRSQAFTEQPDSMGMGTQGSATAAAAGVKDITTERVLLLEQQLEAATSQSRKHEERARSLQQHVDLLNGKVADGSLQIRQLEADIAVKRSNGQHDAGNNETADMSETDPKNHDMQLQHADLTSDVDTLKAKVAQLEAENQAYLSRCKHLSLGMENIVKDLPHDAIQKKYVEAISLVAGLTSKVASVSASERVLQNEREDASRRSLETSQRLTARLRAAQSRGDWNHARLQQAQTQMQDCVSLKVYDGLKQQLPSLTSLMAEQHAFPLEDSAKSDVDLPRLRCELAEAQAEAGTNANKLAAALETCRIQGKALQGSQEQPQRAAVDQDLVKDLVEGQVSLAAALRRADTAEQQLRQAQQAQREERQTIHHLQAQLAALSSGLQQAKQEKKSLEAHFQGGACYEEVHELWQRVTKAEQAASEATADLCTHKDAARHATLELKEVKRESTLRHAEGADLRSALREAQSNRAVPEALATLQAELAHHRSKLSIAQSRANHSETECSSLQDDNAGLSCQVARAEGQLVVNQAKLRWEQAQRLQASAAIESAAAAQVPAYKARAWLTRADHLQKHNDALAQQLDVVSQHLLAAQQAQAHAELSLQHAVQAQESQVDQVTDAQSDRVLQLRIENARLSRVEAALKVKGSSLQEALTALEARMSEFEAEAMGQHAALEQGKQQAERSCHELEEEVYRLQGQLQAQDADLAELHLKCQSAERRATNSTPPFSSPSGQAAATAEGTVSKAMQTSTRNLLLAQVEQLRRSRLEAEEYKEQVAQAQQQVQQQAHSLQQLQQQHQQLLDQLCQQSQRALEGSALQMHQHEGAALDQVQALAQSTIQDLHNKLAARSAEVEDGERRLQAARSLAAAEVGGLQDQIEQLTQQLQLQDQRHVKALVAGSLAQPQVPGDVTSPRHSHLQRLVHQISRERDECQSRLNQLQGQYEWKVDQLQQHIAEQQHTCAQLKAQLQIAHKAEQGGRADQRRQALAAAAKDAKLTHLRRNIHSLEAKLIHAMQTNADSMSDKDTGQGQLQTALQDKARLQTIVQQLQFQVQELQHKGVQPSVPLPSAGAAGHAAPSEQQSSRDESALHRAKISSLSAEVEQLKADKQALLARLTSAEVEEEGGDKLAELDNEVAQLKTDRQLLISRVSTAEQLLAEARRAIEQKEGHLQGLQKLLEEEERTGRKLQQQLREYQASAPMTQQPSRDGANNAADLQAESRQQQIVDLQQQVQLLQHKLDHSESPQGNASPSKLPLQEQQVPQNPIMAEAKAEAHDRPAWQRPMALHLSEAEKAELHVAEAGPPGDENGVTPSLLGGNSGLQLWEEKKKMQKRMENLRAKLKEKNGTIEQLEKEKQKKGEQMQQAHADLARQAALIKDLQGHARGKKEAKPPGVSPEQVRELVKKINGLEEQKDTLERRLAAQQQPSPKLGGDESSPADTTALPLQDQLLHKESELVEARLERSQAEARAQRAQQRLDDFLEEQQAAQEGQAGKGSDSTRQGLLMTIQGLQRALERSRKECQAAVSSAKYMQLLEKKKELSSKVASLEEEARIAAGSKEEAHRLEQRCQQVQATNTALKKQLKALQQGHNQAKALTEQVEGLEVAVESKDAELIALRKTLEQKESQLAQLKEAEGAIDGEAADEIANLRNKVIQVEAENADMRNELSAFDPAFFDEIEDLKYDHHQLQIQCSEYENIVRELSGQLGIDSAVLTTLS